MARIAGIDLPKNKRGEIGLTYIFGIGRSTAKEILAKAGIDEGFGRDSHGIDVATFLCEEAMRRRGEEPPEVQEVL